MLQQGEIVKIKYSKALLQLGLCELVTREAQLTKILYNKRNKEKGAYVIPKTGKVKDEEWFIPIQSIESLAGLNRLRNKGILKSTKL